MTLDLIQLGTQLLIIPLMVWMVWVTPFKGRRDWLVHVLPFAAVSFGLLTTLRWDMSSYYLLLAYPIVFVVVAFKAYRRTTRLRGGRRTPKTLDVITGLAVLAAASVWIAYAVRGYSTPPDPVELSYPFGDGAYYVGGGGNSRLINNHQAVESQKFALDIVRLNASGNRAWPPLPSELEHYTIFGDTVLSPCSGQIQVAVDSLPDLRPPSRDEVNLAGNHLVIRCHDVKVLLAHLMSGSLLVSPGETVGDGQPLARVGNSGNTSEPHLHIHAESGDEMTGILSGEGVPITLEGRFLVRNSLF